MNKKRLLNVAKALRESPAPKKFDMGRYAHSCGTPACALGHYANRRDLQKTFKLVTTGEFEYDELQNNQGEPTWYDDDLVAKHFGLTFGQCSELFSSHGCGDAYTSKQAARFIENFVKKNSAK